MNIPESRIAEDHAVIRAFYDHFMPIDDALFDVIVARMSYSEVAKGQIWIEQGGANDQLGFLVEGLITAKEDIDGDEYYTMFFPAPGFVTEYEGFLGRTPSRHSLVALEACRIYSWSFDALQQMYALDPRGERLGRLIAEQVFADIMSEVRSFRFDSATERYEKLVATYPQLAQRVPQYMLASYLGVTPESLSRIRSKLVKG